MNQFQKNAAFVTGAAIVTVVVSIGLYFGITSHLSDQAKADSASQLAWHNENIRRLKELSVVGIFSPEEQKRLDVAGDDPEKMQQALLDIHQGRSTIWQASLDDAQERGKKLKALVGYSPYGYSDEYQEAAQSIEKDDTKARSQLIEFTAGYRRIENWRPMTFQQYQASLTGKPASPFTATPRTSSRRSDEETQSKPSPRTEMVPVVNRVVSPAGPIYSEPQNGVDTNAITSLVTRYASAMLANDPQAEARVYAEHVDKYYLRSDVDNEFVRDDKQAFLDHGNRITSLRLADLAVEDQTPITASVRYTREVSWVNGSTSTHKNIRSLLHLRRFDEGWKIVYEQDFR
jgi:hypothetical protein